MPQEIEHQALEGGMPELSEGALAASVNSNGYLLGKIVSENETIKAQGKEILQTVKDYQKKTDELIDAMQKATDERIQTGNKRIWERIDKLNERIESHEQRHREEDAAKEATEKTKLSGPAAKFQQVFLDTLYKGLALLAVSGLAFFAAQYLLTLPKGVGP